MRKKIVLILAAVVCSSMLCAMAACAASSPKAAQGEPLVVYLNDFDAMIGEMFKEATGHELEVVMGNGAEILSRIEAERANPHWDVVWIDAMPSVHSLGMNGQLLEGWTPKNMQQMSEFARGFVPENRTYFPTGTHAAGVIVYNTHAFNADTAPKSWEDMLNPQYRVGMADPAVAAPAYPFVSVFFHERGMDGGASYFEELFANGARVYPKNPNVAAALSGGEINVAALQESNAYALKAKGEPVEIVWPADGAPASVRVAAIRKDTPNMEVAKAFVEFLLDPATQKKLVSGADEPFFVPGAAGVNTHTDRTLNGVLDVADAAWAAEHEGEIKEWFADAAAR